MQSRSAELIAVNNCELPSISFVLQQLMISHEVLLCCRSIGFDPPNRQLDRLGLDHDDSCTNHGESAALAMKNSAQITVACSSDHTGDNPLGPYMARKSRRQIWCGTCS